MELIQALGVGTREDGDVLVVEGRGERGLSRPEADLDAGNSGSTARMACGLLATQPFDTRLVGDESLSRRPFQRVVLPLSRMGAVLETTDGRLPVTIRGGRTLHGIDYELPVPSAQVKTAILFAGLFAEGTTRVREKLPSRNHTEIALAAFGAAPRVENGIITLEGGVSLEANRFRLPGDFSSAAFFIAAAAAFPGSDLLVEDVGLNPTRSALLDVLSDMGADISVEVASNGASVEPIGSVHVKGARLHGTDIDPEKVPLLIDEIPILAVVSAFAEGEVKLVGASELRVKESDRLEAILEGLRSLGADVEGLNDGFVIRGARPLRPAALRGFGDHRMVMAWAVAALGVEGECEIDDLEPVQISFPGFFRALDELVH